VQTKNETSDDFLRRTDELAVSKRLHIDDLPDILGFSRASLYAYRAGKRSITRKAWLKLEAAERKAGVCLAEVPPESRQDCAMAESFTHPKEAPPFSLDQSQEIRAIVREELARLDSPAFTMASLAARLTAARAWPPAGPDLHLTPTQLWHKYPPAPTPPP